MNQSQYIYFNPNPILDPLTENWELIPERLKEQNIFKTKEETLLDKLLDRLDTLPEDNEAVQFCLNRKIPKEKFNRLYFILLL